MSHLQCMCKLPRLKIIQANMYGNFEYILFQVKTTKLVKIVGIGRQAVLFSLTLS